jgi:hypothetical protein
MRLLLDQNVADSVAAVFREFGHTVHLVTDILPVDSPDPLIAAVAELDSYVLVSHDRDFETIAPRIPKGSRAREPYLAGMQRGSSRHSDQTDNVICRFGVRECYGRRPSHAGRCSDDRNKSFRVERRRGRDAL